MNIRKIIREQLEETVFQEVAKRAESLPKTTGLFIIPFNKGYELHLYDPKEDKSYGTIMIVKKESEWNIDEYFVDGVAAEKGFGPFMYELAMMHISSEGKGLMSARSGNIKKEAWNVWNKFYERNDIKKKTLKLSDYSFQMQLLTGHYLTLSTEEKEEKWSKASKEDKERTIVFNTVFFKPIDKMYNILTERAKGWKAKKFDTQKATDAGEKLWDLSYRE